MQFYFSILPKYIKQDQIIPTIDDARSICNTISTIVKPHHFQSFSYNKGKHLTMQIKYNSNENLLRLSCP